MGEAVTVEEFDVAGPPTTLPLLARLLRAADLAAGRVTTDWLDAHLPERPRRFAPIASRLVIMRTILGRGAAARQPLQTHYVRLSRPTASR